MTVAQIVWIVGLWLVLVFVLDWSPAEKFRKALRQVVLWVLTTGVVLWALLLFRVLGAFGPIGIG